ncbi:MAG: transporter substrate-binding domain-containing protein [Fibrobacterales bacterium]
MRLKLLIQKSLSRSALIIILVATFTLGYSETEHWNNENGNSLNLTQLELQWIKNHKEIVLGVSPRFEPLAIQNGDQLPTGIVPEIFSQIEKLANVSISVKFNEWPEAVRQATNGETDGLIGCSDAMTRATDLKPTISLRNIYPVIYAKKNTPFKIGDFNDLKNLRVTIPRSHKMLNEILKPHEASIKIEKVNTTFDALTLVSEGKADAAVGVSTDDYIINKYGIPGVEIVHFDFKNEYDVMSCIRSDWPELVSIINKSINYIGKLEVDRIFSKWIGEYNQKNIKLADDEKKWLSEHPVITVGSALNRAPIEWMDSKGTHHGISIDYLKAIEKMLPVSFKILKEPSFDSLIIKAFTGELDLFTNVSFTKKREPFFSFSNPYLSFPVMIYSRSDVPYISDVSLLKGKKVAAIKGYAVEEWLKRDYPNIEIVSCSSTRKALMLLINNKVDAFLGNIYSTGYVIGKEGLTNIKVAGETEYTYDGRMAVPKRNLKLLSIIQKALDAMPEYQKVTIRKQWSPISYIYDHSLLWKVLFIVGVIVLLFVWSNIKLRKVISKRSKQILASDVHLRQLFENSSVGFMRTELATGRTVTCNLEFAEIFGFTSKNECILMLQFSKQLVTGSLRDTQLQTLMREGRVAYVEEFKRNDGRSVWLSVSEKIVANKMYTDGVVIDITEIRDMKMMLNQSNKMRLIGQMTGGIAHDFNNSLAGIMGLTQIAIKKLDSDHDLHTYLDKIMTASNRASDLIARIMAFSHSADTGMRPMKLSEIIDEVVDLLKATIPSTIQFQVSKNNSMSLINGNDTKIHEAIMNLVTNAIHSIGEKGTLNIALFEKEVIEASTGYLGVIKPQKYNVIEVTDTGKGIDKKALHKIFEPFYTTKNKGEGTGFGLAVVFELMQLHEGNIQIDSTPNSGTTFRLYFPNTISKDYKTQKVAMDAPKGSERILFVDDEDMLTDIGHEYLTKYGYRVTTASNGKNALNLFKQNPYEYDLVITDQTMPHLTGYELAQGIFNVRPGLPVIICSGYSAHITEEDCFNLGVKCMMQKPINNIDMGLKIREILDVT